MKNPIVESELMGTSAAGKILDVTPQRVIQLAKEGKLQFITIPGGQRLYTKEAVERLRKEREGNVR